MQRYIIGLAGVFYMALSVAMFAPIFAPMRYPGLARPDTFVPLLDLFQISGAILACAAILSVHPIITDGHETHGMHTPLAHPGLHAVLVLAIAALPLLVLSDPQPERFWQAERLADTCRHLLRASGAAALMVIVGFYPLKWRAQMRRAMERQPRA